MVGEARRVFTWTTVLLGRIEQDSILAGFRRDILEQRGRDPPIKEKLDPPR